MSRIEGIELLETLCMIPGPTGSEDRVAEKIYGQLSDAAGTEIRHDKVGNLIVKYPCGKKDAPKIMVSAHMDEVGMMINEITDDGYLKFGCLGGIDPRVLCGRNVTVMGEKGDLPGVIASKAIHHQTAEERKTATEVENMYISIGAENKKQAEEYVAVGDSATFYSDFYRFGTDGRFMCCKAIDDRLGCTVMIDVLRKIIARGKPLEYDVYFCFTTREEIGISGAQTAAQAIEPDVSIVLESTAVADLADVKESSKVGKLGEGGAISLADRSTIYDRRLIDLAFDISEKQKIKAQVKKMVSGGNDAGHIHKSGRGVRSLAISAPARYIHSASNVACTEDFESIEKLVYALLCSGELA